MASIIPRRASYQLETEHRSSVKAVHAADRRAGDGKLEQVQDEHHEQQPSPQVVKPFKLDGQASADNNQEEESVADNDALCVSVSELRDEEFIRPASPITYTGKVDKRPRHLQQLRKQAAANRDPPLTTARQRQENAALKLQLAQLGNQHESEIQALKSQLAETALAHEQTEKSLKKQIDELEKRQLETAENTQKYQANVEALQKVLHRLDSRAKGSVSSSPSRTHVETLSTLLVPPREATWQPAATILRHGSDETLPRHTNLAKSGGIKPFAWRAESSPAMNGGASVMPNRVPLKAVGNRTSFVPTSVAEIQPSPRCIPIRTHSTQYTLPPPLAAVKEHQHRPAPLTKKPSGGSLLAYCADMITAKLAAHAPVLLASTPKSNMKVMPVWSPEDNMVTTNGLTIPVPDAQASDDEYTAITIL